MTKSDVVYTQVFDCMFARLRLNALATVHRLTEAGDQNLRRPWTPDELETELIDALYAVAGALQFADICELEQKAARLASLLEDTLDVRTPRRSQVREELIAVSKVSYPSFGTFGRLIGAEPPD